MGECFILRRGGSSKKGYFPSLFVTGLESTDTCTLANESKTYSGVWTSKGSLPSAYQEVEYIESTGTQYINTGVTPKYGQKFEFELSCSNTSSNNYVLGSTANSDNSYGSYPLMMYNGTHYASFNTSSWAMAKVGTYTAGTKYAYEVNYASGSQTVTQNGTTIGTSTNSSTITNTYPYYLLALNSVGTASRFFSGKLYSMSIYDGEELIRDFVPCYRVSDNVVGLYDTVTGTFYMNSGTGTFGKGADVNVGGFYFSQIDKIGTYTLTYTSGSETVLIDAPIEYDIEV